MGTGEQRDGVGRFAMGGGVCLQPTWGDALPLLPPSLPRFGVSLLGPAGSSQKSSQAAASLLGWQLLGSPWHISKPGLKLQFLM